MRIFWEENVSYSRNGLRTYILRYDLRESCHLNSYRLCVRITSHPLLL